MLLFLFNSNPFPPFAPVLRKAFDMFDRDKKGYIHTNMVSTILRTLGQTFEENDLQQLIIEIDADGKWTKNRIRQQFISIISDFQAAVNWSLTSFSPSPRVSSWRRTPRRCRRSCARPSACTTRRATATSPRRRSGRFCAPSTTS